MMKLGNLYCGLLCLSVCIGLGTTAESIAATVKVRTKHTAQPAFREHAIFKGKLSPEVAQGEKQLLAGKYQDASNSFWKALNKNSKDTNALCGLGYVQALQFKLDAAEEQFNKALKINPNSPLALVGKAFVKVNRLQTSNMTIIKQKSGLLASAESDLRRALKADKNMPEALIVLAMVQKEQGKPNEAIVSLNRAIQIDPKYSMAFTKRGLLFVEMGNLASAEQDFLQAISLRSSNAAAHFGLGRVYLAQGKIDAALKELNTALYLNRNSAPIHIAMGDCYQRQGNLNAAINSYQQAIAIKSENEEAYLKLADIREFRADLELALAELRGGVEANKWSAPLHRRMADICLKLEKLDDAIKEYNTTLQIYPGDAAAVKGMTRAYILKAQKEANGAFFLSNNYEQAESMIQRAIAMNPNDLELRLIDAKFRAMSGKPVDLNNMGTPTSDPQRIAYSEALLAQFRFDEAVQQMSIVINNANDAATLLAIADMSLLIRDLDSAEAAFKKAAGFADSSARAKIGLDRTQTARSNAQKDLTFANDLAAKKQLPSSIDKYRSAAFLNPRLAQAHFGLAEALVKLFSKNPPSLREACLHYRAYMSLEKNMPEKEKEKLEKKIQKLEEKAYKIEMKGKR